ncbi:hypothetical protein D3C83_166530 [compost metagenome]
MFRKAIPEFGNGITVFGKVVAEFRKVFLLKKSLFPMAGQKCTGNLTELLG